MRLNSIHKYSSFTKGKHSSDRYGKEVCISTQFQSFFFLFRYEYSKGNILAKLSLRKAARTFSNDVPSSPDISDRWEMKSANIDFQDIVGKGAFGQVYIADVDASRMSSMYKQLTRRDSKKKQYKRNHQITVAVKVLRGNELSSHGLRWQLHTCRNNFSLLSKFAHNSVNL